MVHTKSRCESVMNVETKQGWILLPEQIEYLKNNPYMYNATAGSILEVLFLQKFWTKLVPFIPHNTAPCVLTCAGLLINLLCCFTVLCYSSNLENDAPSWAFVLCAIGVFLYSTLDALDGKQAIRVQNTQIEEVYDHGCDAVSNVFVSLAVCAACRLANIPLFMFTFFLTSIVTFYTTHWQDHITHVMIFGIVDVSEAQFTIIMIHLTTAIFGQNVWLKQVAFGIEYRHILGAAVLVSMTRLIVANLTYIFGRRTPLDEFVKIPRKVGSGIWNPFVPLAILTTCFVRAYASGTLEYSPCLCMIAFGLAYAKITVKLVTCNVTNADMDIWDSGLVAPLLIFINTYLSIIPVSTALLCSLVYNLMDLARYFTYLSWDLREALDVWIFSLKYPVNHPKCRNGNQGYYMNGLNDDEIKKTASERSLTINDSESSLFGSNMIKDTNISGYPLKYTRSGPSIESDKS